MVKKSLTIQVEAEGRVDIVVQKLCETSRSGVKGLIDHHCVHVNDRLCQNAGKTVAVGDTVRVDFDSDRRYREKKRKWDDRCFDIIFEDDHLIVVDKAAGTLTVPTDHQEVNTLVDRLSIYLSHSRRSRDAWLVHRLDRHVSGLLVFGKHEKVAQALIDQFKSQKPRRSYLAIVKGVVTDDEGTFRDHLATGNNLDRFVSRESKDTELAITHYRVVRRFSDTTLVEVQLETGKRNQIRVQFAHANHPVLGDPRYQKSMAKHPRWIRRRIALHAQSLGLVHPVTGTEMTFESPVPRAMSKFISGSR